MRRVVLCVLCCCVLASSAFLSQSAKAGDGGYYREGRAWYTSSCCYRKIVRNETDVRYVRITRSDRAAGYYRSYRDDPSWGYGPPPYGPAYGSWRGAGWRYANFLPPPDCRLVRLTDGAGGWIWARRAGCL